MSRQVKVSYVVLTKDSGKTLRATLDTISRQKLSKEIVVIDTDSKDDTLKIAKEFNVKVFNEPTGNLAKARNLGLDNAKGQYLAFVDSDCILFDGWDKRMIAYLREDNVAGIGCNCRSVGNSLVEKAQDELAFSHRGVVETNSIATMNVMYDRKRIGDILFDERFSGAGEDLDFNFQLRAKGFRLLLDSSKYVFHHNPTTLGSLMSKSYRYGKWFMKPYMKHKAEKNTSFELRRLFLSLFMFNFVVGLILPPWMLFFILQLFVPFAVYYWEILDLRYVFIHGMKFYAHMFGMVAGLFE